MASTLELKRAAQEMEAAISGIRSALDRTGRVLRFAAAHSLATELAGLAQDEVIQGNVDKERMADLASLGASIAFYLDGAADGSNTLLGTPPLSGPQMKALMDKLGI